MQASAEQEGLRFLDQYDANLRMDIEEAELLLRTKSDKPYQCTVECRRFLERFAKCLAARHGLPKRGELGNANETLDDFIHRLSRAKQTGMKAHVYAWTKQIRRTGNAVHVDVAIGRRDAAEALENCKKLAYWFDGRPYSYSRPNAEQASPNTKPGVPTDVKASAPNVVEFPKREDAPLREYISQPALNEDIGPASEDLLSRRWIAPASVLGLVSAALVAWLLWPHAATPPLPSSPQRVDFAQAQPFMIVPGEGATYVNERDGPGTNYPVLRQMVRGTNVSGIARTFDAQNVAWIALSDGQGYVKEALLTTPPPSPPAPTPVPPPAPVQPAPTPVPQVAPATKPADPPSMSQAPVSAEPRRTSDYGEQFVSQGRNGTSMRAEPFAHRPTMLPPRNMMFRTMPRRYQTFRPSFGRMQSYQERSVYMRPRFRRP